MYLIINLTEFSVGKSYNWIFMTRVLCLILLSGVLGCYNQDEIHDLQVVDTIQYSRYIDSVSMRKYRMCYMDTLSLDCPVGLIFRDTIPYYIPSTYVIATDSSELKHLNKSEEYSFNKIVESKGYLIYHPASFQLFLLHHLEYVSNQDRLFYSKLQDIMSRESEFECMESDGNGKFISRYTSNGIEYCMIKPRKFWLFLIKGSMLKLCEPRGSARFQKNQNLYYRVIVPYFD